MKDLEKDLKKKELKARLLERAEHLDQLIREVDAMHDEYAELIKEAKEARREANLILDQLRLIYKANKE